MLCRDCLMRVKRARPSVSFVRNTAQTTGLRGTNTNTTTSNAACATGTAPALWPASTHVCNVHGYLIDDGEKVPDEGRLSYRGLNVTDIVNGLPRRGALCL